MAGCHAPLKTHTQAQTQNVADAMGGGGEIWLVAKVKEASPQVETAFATPSAFSDILGWLA